MENKSTAGFQGISPVSIIDATQLPTPLPVLSLKKKIASSRVQDIIQINVRDSYICEDIESFCNNSNNIYLGKKIEGISISCFVQKK